MHHFAPLPLYLYANTPGDQTVAPPYDLLDEQARAEYAAKSPHNVVHASLPCEGEDARATIDHWRAGGIITPRQPAYYLLGTDFEEAGENITRMAVLGGLALSGGPTPCTLEPLAEAAVADRLENLRSVRGHISPSLALCNDPDCTITEIAAEVAGTEPLATAVLPGPTDGDNNEVVHRLWAVPKLFEERIARMVQDKPLLIADGHHRMEAARRYALERGEGGASQPWGRMFTAVVNEAAPGIRTLPYHRAISWYRRFDWENIIERLATRFVVTPLPPDTGLEALATTKHPHATLLVLGTGRMLLTPRLPAGEQELTAQVLERDLLIGTLGIPEERLRAEDFVRYDTNAGRLLIDVADGELQAAIFVKPVDVTTLRTLCASGQPRPQKTVTIEPRVPAGLAYHLFDYTPS